MPIIKLLQIIFAVATILTGLFSLLKPRSIQDFTGLRAPGARGITEFRAVFGGGFIALGAAPLLLNAQAAYQMLGIMYVLIAVVRVISIFVDKSPDQSNWISLVIEVAAGVVLLL